MMVGSPAFLCLYPLKPMSRGAKRRAKQAQRRAERKEAERQAVFAEAQRRGGRSTPGFASCSPSYWRYEFIQLHRPGDPHLKPGWEDIGETVNLAPVTPESACYMRPKERGELIKSGKVIFGDKHAEAMREART